MKRENSKWNYYVKVTFYISVQFIRALHVILLLHFIYFLEIANAIAFLIHNVINTLTFKQNSNKSIQLLIE